MYITRNKMLIVITLYMNSKCYSKEETGGGMVKESREESSNIVLQKENFVEEDIMPHTTVNIFIDIAQFLSTTRENNLLQKIMSHPLQCNLISASIKR